MKSTQTLARALLRDLRNSRFRSTTASPTSYLSPSRPVMKLTISPAHSVFSNKHFSTQERTQSNLLQLFRFLVSPSSSVSNSSVTKRSFSHSTILMHEHLTPPKAGEELHITFVDKEGDEHTFSVSKGDNLLDIALDNDLEMEGACGGSCACSTCHVIVEDEALYDKMDEPDDDENDMLDLAFGLTETSRLGCQVKMRPELDGLKVRLPAMTRNLQASDFSKKNERSD